MYNAGSDDPSCTYLVADFADGWSDRADDILRLRTIEFLHLLYDYHTDTPNGAAPSGMCRRNHALHWIVQKQRYAVCIERHKRNSNLLRDESVNLREITFPHDTLSTVIDRTNIATTNYQSTF